MAIFVSASAIKDYLSCQTKAYYRIYQPKVSVPTKEMIMGRIAHKVIEKMWNDEEGALIFCKELCAREKMDSLSTNLAIGFVRTFFDSFTGYINSDDKIEQKFKIPLQTDVFLVGVFDRISNENIFDWKTNSVTPKRLDNDPQFIIYNYAYESIYGKKPASSYLASVRDGSLVRYRESSIYTDEMINKIIPDYISTIRKNIFTKDGLFKGSCFRCPYKSDCIKE